ncbi:secreted RxLR effector protein 161-like [Oryza glaberrima]|uniref:secreted RxLR effector protein 161-like n=1 Tax=Oryza glaberrima TaxID=4538 RepID=UPI00224C380C|nr:secreted RxLR effector protein 161-like [Oryza glaberrima]
METRLKRSKFSSEPSVDATAYRSIVRSLRYLVNTYPDLAFAVGYASRFLEDPREDHLVAVKHILHYMAGTKNLGVWFSRKVEKEAYLRGFSESGYAGDVDARKSMTGVIFFLGSSPITWQSMKQKVVVQSSCEAEYIAAANAACQPGRLQKMEAAENGLIIVEFIRSEEQLGDILTKPLGKTKFHELRSKIGLINISSEHNKS